MSDAKRIRRTPEEARRVILDAAEACMARGGPASIRLQEVADAAGVSHPTILHHFESREGLIRALNQRTVEDLKTALMAVMEAAERTSTNAVATAFAAYRNGFAERILWLLQTQSLSGAMGLTVFDEMVDALDATRRKHAGPNAALDRFDSQAVVHLITIAAFGDALVGPRLRRADGAPAEHDARDRFERWLGELVEKHIATAWNKP